MPAIANITDRRKELIYMLLDKYTKQDIAKAVKKANQSNFLQGQNDRSWKANLDWMLIEENFAKIIEGNYDSPVNNYL